VTPTGLEGHHVTGNHSNDLSQSPISSDAESGAISTQFGATGDAAHIVADPGLALLIDRWPTLPEATKVAILAMVREVV